MYALSQATTLQPEWIAWVFARNYLVMAVMYGGWHWFLFDSAYAAVMKTKKFDPKIPSVRSNVHVCQTRGSIDWPWTRPLGWSHRLGYCLIPKEE